MGSFNKDTSPLSDLPGGSSPRQPDEPPDSSTLQELILCKLEAESVWRNIDSLEEAALSIQWGLNTLNPGQAHPVAEQNRGTEPCDYTISLVADLSETVEYPNFEANRKVRPYFVGGLLVEVRMRPEPPWQNITPN